MNFKNRMHPLNFVLLIVIAFTGFSVKSQTVDIKKLDKYIQNAQKQWNILGLAIAIVKDDKVIFSKGYGVKEYGKKDKVTDKSLFAIASNTKAFTAGALSILVDEGKISWDDPVRKYLPYFE
ncbi:MAG: beta-lactamase family protein, partial [Bacteroidales bacterium]|nr:beta-lactamase family protein [Bacteroidales bacterium]